MGVYHTRRLRGRDPTRTIAAALRQLVPTGTLTASLEADMETKAVSFAFHLPSWAVWPHGEADLTERCLRHSSES